MPTHDPQIPPPSAQALSLGDLKPASQPGAPVFSSIPNPLHQVKATLTVRVGTVEVTVGELLAAREHQILTLDRLVDEPVDLLLEGQVVARGALVAVDDHFGVKITELPLPLKP